MTTNTEKEKQLDEVYKRIGPLSMGCQDSELIAIRVRNMHYDPARREEVLKKLGKYEDNTTNNN